MTSPEWMRAAALLAQGERAEAAQWLDAHAQAHPADADTAAMAWLRAQTLSDREQRLAALRRLVRTHPPDDRYVRLARETLAIEERYAPPKAPRRRLTVGAVGMAALALVAVIWGGFNLFTPAAVADPTPTATALMVVIEPTATATLPPSQPQPVDLAPVTYGAGVLRVLTIEDGARAVVSRSTGQLARPISGAQFYVVRLGFECRTPICERPPQATVQLVLSDGFTLDPRADVAAVGDPAFPPVALGIVSEGLLVFEAPIVSVPARLLVTPLNEAERPLALNLRGAG
ncbi:hypothetical protein VZO05_08480 [Aggregatilineales bacterium SYSU G02658]